MSAEWLKRYLVYLRLTKKSEDFSGMTSSRNSTRRSFSVPPVRAVSRSRSADPSRRSMGQTQRKSGATHVLS